MSDGRPDVAGVIGDFAGDELDRVAGRSGRIERGEPLGRASQPAAGADARGQGAGCPPSPPPPPEKAYGQ